MPSNPERTAAATVIVPAPPDAVWALASDPDRFAEWLELTEEVTRADKPLRLGSTYEERNVVLGPLKGSSTYNKQLSLRFVGRDAAIVVSESGILFAGETEVPDTAKVNATWVFEKRNGQWLIAAYHNSPVLAPGQ